MFCVWKSPQRVGLFVSEHESIAQLVESFNVFRFFDSKPGQVGWNEVELDLAQNNLALANL
jgi:hypothetical protein